VRGVKAHRNESSEKLDEVEFAGSIVGQIVRVALLRSAVAGRSSVVVNRESRSGPPARSSERALSSLRPQNVHTHRPFRRVQAASATIAATATAAAPIPAINPINPAVSESPASAEAERAGEAGRDITNEKEEQSPTDPSSGTEDRKPSERSG
jgi:hypothetical protein